MASRNPAHVAVSSRFLVDNLSAYYERAIRANAHGRLLDMGCGHVPFYATYRDLVAENVCIDWANTLHVNPFLDHVLDLSGPLPFEAESFDTILLTDVLEHIAEPQEVMREIARLMRPGGRLILGVPFLYRIHEEPHDYFRYTEFALRRFCEGNGLTIIELEPYGGLPEVFVDLSFKSLDLLPSPLRALLRPVPALLTLISRTALCRKFSRASSASFPQGYVLVAGKLC
jgi:SAM-dependent methyltransferase